MAGTSTVEVKQALVAGIAAALPDVQVAYSWPGRTAGRECVYCGDASFTQKPMAFCGGGRVPRDELVTVDVHVHVTEPGATAEETEARAAELGEELEHALAADPHLVGLASLVTGGELLSGFEDEESFSVLTYQVQVRARLE